MVSMDMAAAILRRGKQLAPDRFPQPDPEITRAWAKALDKNVPAQLWEEAVNVWATTMVSDRMCTPRDVLEALAHATRRWESDPVLGPQLRAHRLSQRDERDRQLAAGTFAADRGYTAAGPSEPRAAIPPGIQHQLEALAQRKRIKP